LRIGGVWEAKRREKWEKGGKIINRGKFLIKVGFFIDVAKHGSFYSEK
jgi:hypothetical protein